MKALYVSLLLSALPFMPLFAQDGLQSGIFADKAVELQANVGLNIGGSTPLGMPREVRKVRSFNPRLNGTLEAKATKWWGEGQRWGTSLGVRLENKSMKVGADVKNYHTEIIREGDKVAGYWTGYVNIKYSVLYLTVPVTADYRLSESWKVRAGLFASFNLDGDFSGHVTDGYLRSGEPTGEKIVYDKGQRAEYDFSDDLRKADWGAQLGASWKFYGNFSLNGDLTYAFGNIFKDGFSTVKEKLHPLYLNIGVGYSF